jgi:DNA polymerase-4
VEQRDHPELRGKPVAVGGSGKRGVVASASYEARRYGVRSAMPGGKARRLCPELLFVRPRFEVYRAVSAQIRSIFLEYTDLVEPLSLDEAYLDVTHPRQGPASATLIAREIRARIVRDTGLTASAGVSFNKFLAKVASDINKPNGMKVILPEQAEAFLDALPIEAFHGIGRVTAARMLRQGIRNGADLRQRSLIELVRQFGKAGRHYYHLVRAEDDRPVNPNRVRKSIGAERTFGEDITDTESMKEKLTYICGVVFNYMEKRRNFGRTITLKVKTPDFQIMTRSRTLLSKVRLRDQLRTVALELLDQHRGDFESVRLLGITVSNLEKEHENMPIQLEIPFEEE